MSANHTTIKFGFAVPEDENAVQRLEDAGVTSLWTGGHLAAPMATPEALVGLTRLAAISRTATVGTAVIVLPLYPPAIVAKQVAEIDQIANGRTVLGVGVGGEFAGDYEAVQVPPSERGRRANEAIPLLRRLWEGDAVDHDGRFYPMHGVRVNPPPVQSGGPPIIVAGRQPAAMRRAALLGEGWMPYMYTPRRYRESVSSIHELAAAGGVSLDGFGWYLWTSVCIRDDGAEARRELADFLKRSTGQDFEPIITKVALAGNPDEVSLRLAEFVDAGVRHFIFAPIPNDGFRSIRRITGDVMPALAAHTARR